MRKAEAIANLKKGQSIFSFQKGTTNYTKELMTYDEFVGLLDNLSEEDRRYHETFYLTQPIKLFFDIDCKGVELNQDEILAELDAKVREQLALQFEWKEPLKRLTLVPRKGQSIEKFSLHVIYDGVVFEDVEDLRIFASSITLEKVKLDLGVLNTRTIRFPFNQKLESGEGGVLIPLEGSARFTPENFGQYTVTFFQENSMRWKHTLPPLPSKLLSYPEEQKRVRKKYRMGSGVDENDPIAKIVFAIQDWIRITFWDEVKFEVHKDNPEDKTFSIPIIRYPCPLIKRMHSNHYMYLNGTIFSNLDGNPGGLKLFFFCPGVECNSIIPFPYNNLSGFVFRRGIEKFPTQGILN